MRHRAGGRSPGAGAPNSDLGHAISVGSLWRNTRADAPKPRQRQCRKYCQFRTSIAPQRNDETCPGSTVVAVQDFDAIRTLRGPSLRAVRAGLCGRDEPDRGYSAAARWTFGSCATRHAVNLHDSIARPSGVRPSHHVRRHHAWVLNRTQLV